MNCCFNGLSHPVPGAYACLQIGKPLYTHNGFLFSQADIMAAITFRPAVPEDAATCIAIRALTRENAFTEEDLRALGITVDTWSSGIRDGCSPGFVACNAEEIVGYCFADKDSGEVTVLALLPAYEGQGTGKRLLQRVVDQLRELGFEHPFLACSSDPNVRSYGFYRHLGWKPTGEQDEAGDEILQLSSM